MAFLFAKYLRECIYFTVISIFFGASLKLIAPKDNFALYLGQFLISLAGPYAYVNSAQIGSLIFSP